MRPTEQTLLDQMQISEFEIEKRKELLSIDQADAAALMNCRTFIEANLDSLVNEFYELQTSIPAIALLIGDAGTLERLKNAQRKYTTDLFSGVYDLDYVNNRLRIGLVHKRIGVEPKLYLSAIYTLKFLLFRRLSRGIPDPLELMAALSSLDKLLFFDITLVFETYIRSLVGEIAVERDKTTLYARSLEEKVKDRTLRLEELTRTDPLTGLLNRRYLTEALARTIASAKRRQEPVSLIYFDIDNFKNINDLQGHQHGDKVLRSIGDILKEVSRELDSCFRHGGDEFCIILPNCSHHQAREAIADRLTAAISTRLSNITISLGIVQTGPAEFLDADQLIHKADIQMYEAKRGGRLSIPQDVPVTDPATLVPLSEPQIKVA